MCYYLVTPHWILTSYNLGQDWITYHPGPAWLPAHKITPRKQRQASPQVHRSQQVATQSKPQAVMHPNKQQHNSKLITSKDQIMLQYPDVFKGIGKFLGPPYTIHLDPSVSPKQTPCWPVPIHLKESFKKEIDKMLQAGVLKPVIEAIPWINSFILVRKQRQVRQSKTTHMPWTHKPEQGYNMWALSLQNARWHRSPDCRCLHNDSLWLLQGILASRN